MPAPKISVVTPSFNQARFLDETLRSVLAQRDAIHEYFVIDGGSTDGSADVIRRHESQIDYWVSEPDSGQADAIHKGFRRATGDVLYWLNSDDVLLPGAIARVRRAFDENSHWDALTAWHVRMDAESRILSMHRIPAENPRRARWGMHHVNQQTCYFKRALYERVGPIDPNLHCVLDTELWSRIPTATRVLSPAPWPYWSLISLNRSRSRRINAAEGGAARTSASNLPRKNFRFASPVRASW